MPKKYMVFWKPEQKPDDKYIALIPEEIKKRGRNTKEKGKNTGRLDRPGQIKGLDSYESRI